MCSSRPTVWRRSSTAAAVRWSRRSAPRPAQLTTDIDRVTADALKSIETRGQAFSQSMTTHGSEVARTITSAGDLATGAVAKSLKDLEQSSRVGDRPVASGLDRGRHRNAGDQQDPAHRHGRAVRAAARRQHPAAGSADRRPRQPQLAGARAGDPRGRLRVRHERRHLAQRRRHADAGRPAHRLQQQDLEGAGGSRLAVERVREARQGTGRGRRRGRTGQPHHHDLGRRPQVGSWNCW